ncbi:exportin-1 [Metarhizium robertsii ARSEF 23]|uniref:Exportin-1 n=1 Tax=Metarhizium robertsii (strain ARSEF 23 / ATCC MYA-3075) TaxID=655844 RepID=E9ERH9_METRA|nr:exportin-1 [Metarhizium robertsii ARSEF 23]EFZ01346.2 exportin-1 [Metarhizium robertsii ARSEF 23]
MVITSGGGVTTRAQSRSEGTIQRHTKQDQGTEYMNPQRHSEALHRQLQLSGAPRRGGKLSKKGICYKTSNSRRRTSHNLPAPPGVGQRHILQFTQQKLHRRQQVDGPMGK